MTDLSLRKAVWASPCLFIAMLFGMSAVADDADFYLKTVLHIGGDGGFDYVTLARDSHRLYLPRASHTQVVDSTDGKVLADIPDNARSHGVVLVPSKGRGFISNGGDGTVQIFDLKSNKSLGKVKAAEDADCIIFDSASNNVLTFCGDAHQMVSIPVDVDPKTGHANATLELGGKPEFAVSDGKGKVFVNIVDKDVVAVIDTKAMTVITKWPVTPGKQPVAMSMDHGKGRLFIGCRNQKLVVMDANEGRILAHLPIGVGVDSTQFVDGTAFASCGDGTLAVIRENADGEFRLVQTLKTAPRAKTMAIDETTRTIYLPTADGDRKSPVPGSFKVLVVEPRK